MPSSARDGTRPHGRTRRRRFFGGERGRMRLHATLLVLAGGSAVAYEVFRGAALPAGYDPVAEPSFRAGRILGAALFFLIFLTILNWVLLGSGRLVRQALLWVPAILAVSLASACLVATALVSVGSVLGAVPSGGIDWSNVEAAFDGVTSLVPTVAILMAFTPVLIPLDVLVQLPEHLRLRRRSGEERDEQTGLPVRRDLIRRVAEELDRARRYQRPLTLALVELDGFVTFQMEHGRDAEDDVLRHLGLLLPRLGRDVDRIGRWDASEFLAVLPETDVEAATTFAQRVRAGIEDYGYVVTRQYPGPALTASIGLVQATAEAKGPEDLIRRAQIARAHAKASGGNAIST